MKNDLAWRPLSHTVLQKGVEQYMVTNCMMWRPVSHEILEKGNELKTRYCSSKKKDQGLLKRLMLLSEFYIFDSYISF